jgi:phosphoserine phosphatase
MPPTGAAVPADLVVQGPALTEPDARALAELAEAQPPVALAGTPPAWRLASPGRREQALEACAERGADGAFVPRDRLLRDVRVVAMDMDSTLITIECIDEIADRAGIKQEVAAITASAMRGEIDFAESLARRVALLAGLPVDALDRVYDERLRLSPGAESMLAGFRGVGARTMLVSGGFTYFTDRLKDRLGFDETASNTLEVASGKLTGRVLPPIVDAAVKAARFAAMRRQYVASGGIAVAIGDGANDLPMMKAADVSIAYRAKPVVRAQATHAIDHCGLDAALHLFA